MEYPDIESLLAAVGDHLGYSDWVVIDQNRINGFAAATGDNQWIHVDPELAATGPFGTTIAHGYLTLSMTNQFLPELLQVPLATMGINYGANKIRFPRQFRSTRASAWAQRSLPPKRSPRAMEPGCK